MIHLGHPQEKGPWREEGSGCCCQEGGMLVLPLTLTSAFQVDTCPMSSLSLYASPPELWLCFCSLRTLHGLSLMLDKVHSSDLGTSLTHTTFPDSPHATFHFSPPRCLGLPAIAQMHPVFCSASPPPGRPFSPAPSKSPKAHQPHTVSFPSCL